MQGFLKRGNKEGSVWMDGYHGERGIKRLVKMGQLDLKHTGNLPAVKEN
jgi:hypothetical protein